MQIIYIHVFLPHGEKHIDTRFELQIKLCPLVSIDTWILRPFKEP